MTQLRNNLKKYLDDVSKSSDFICITYNSSHISSIMNLFTEGWKKKEDGAIREGNIKYFSYDSLKHTLKMDLTSSEKHVHINPNKEIKKFTAGPLNLSQNLNEIIPQKKLSHGVKVTKNINSSLLKPTKRPNNKLATD